MNAIPHQKPDFNVEIGKRLMLVRLSANLSQGELGEKIDVSAQQVHKYETGENRLSAETIKQLAQIFGVSVNYFYADDDILNSDLDKNIISITSEIINFPEDVRGDLLSLVKSVKRMVKNTNT
ncbi:MAG: helix-turn-helix transcriptional regulator [Pseudomonadota bacterium]